MPSYITKEIALLDAHDITDNDTGKVVVHIDDDFLREVARNNNIRVAETGDEIPVIIGHTKDKQDESKSPEIVGWASRFVVKKLYNADRNAVWATVRFLKDKLQKLKAFPRRSVELWFKRKLIDPIALLGATSPERHLGLLKFSAGDQRATVESPMPDQVQEIVDKVMAALSESDVWKWVQSKMEAEGADENAEDAAAAGALPVEAPMEQPGEELLKQDAAMPGGGNTFVPGGNLKDEKKPYAADNGDALRLQASYGVLERKYAQQQENYNTILAKFRRVEHEKDLIQLEAKSGIVLDVSEELEHTANMDDAQFAQHKGLILKRYQRAPVGGLPFASKDTVVPQTRTVDSQDKARLVADFALKNSLSYTDALKKFQADQI